MRGEFDKEADHIHAHKFSMKYFYMLTKHKYGDKPIICGYI
jgi:hypothetical protein